MNEFILSKFTHLPPLGGQAYGTLPTQVASHLGNETGQMPDSKTRLTEDSLVR
jgi:hypothetical protein